MQCGCLGSGRLSSQENWVSTRVRFFTESYSCDQRAFEALAPSTASRGAPLPHSFLFVGRFIPEKGVDTLLEAYAMYREIATDPWPLVVLRRRSAATSFGKARKEFESKDSSSRNGCRPSLARRDASFFRVYLSHGVWLYMKLHRQACPSLPPSELALCLTLFGPDTMALSLAQRTPRGWQG